MRCSPPCVHQLCLSNRGDISPNLPCDSASEGRAVFFYLSNSWRFLCSSDTKPVLFASADAGEWNAFVSAIGKRCLLTSAQEPKPASIRPIGHVVYNPRNSKRKHHALSPKSRPEPASGARATRRAVLRELQPSQRAVPDPQDTAAGQPHGQVRTATIQSS